MSTFRALAALILVALMSFSALSAPHTRAQSAPAGGTVREFDLPHGRAVALSPDGAKLAAWDRGDESLCVYAVATMTEMSCAGATGLTSGIRVGDIVWSPDSTRLAFGETAFITYNDGDLWVMDASTGALIDLVDDHYHGPIAFLAEGDDDVTFSVEVAPAWTPDSQFITFSSTQFRGNEVLGNVIAQVPAAGAGEVEILATVSATEAGVVYYGTGWSADGEHFYYSVAYASPDRPDNGVWVYDKRSGATRQLATSDDPELGPLALRQVSPAGDRLLAYYPATLAQGYIGKSVQRFIDPETGALSSIPDPNPESEIFGGSWFSTFSPDGRYLLQPTNSGGDAFAYWVTDLASGESTQVASELAMAVPIDGMLSPVWASNGLVGVARGIDGAYLFPIDGAGIPVISQAGTPASGSPVAVAETIEEGADAVTTAIAPIFAGPNTESPLAYVLPAGRLVHVLSDPVQNAEGSWYPIFDPVTQIIGYIQADRLEPTA